MTVLSGRNIVVDGNLTKGAIWNQIKLRTFMPPRSANAVARYVRND